MAFSRHTWTNAPITGKTMIKRMRTVRAMLKCTWMVQDTADWDGLERGP